MAKKMPPKPPKGMPMKGKTMPGMPSRAMPGMMPPERPKRSAKKKRGK